MRGYRYRLYPTRAQEAELMRLMDICCETYNAALEQRIDWWKRHEVILDSRGAWHPERGRDRMRSQTRQLQEARKDLGIQIPAQLHNHVLVRLDRAFDAFRRRRREGKPGGFPRFCPRRRWRTLVFPSHGQSHRWLPSEGRYDRVRLSGIGDIRVRTDRPLPNGADLGQATVTLAPTGRWEISILVRSAPREPLPETGRRVGINRGVRHLLATSDGRIVDGLGLRAAAARELASAQRALSRTQRGSKGREKARRRLARASARIAAERDRRLGELARELASDYDEIVIEAFDVATMLRRAGEVSPELANRISEQGWSILERRLRDRCERHGRILTVVDPAGISQTCPRCGAETPHSMGAKRFRCGTCSYEDDRDVAAAKIVLQRADDPEMVRERYGADELTQDSSQGEVPA